MTKERYAWTLLTGEVNHEEIGLEIWRFFFVGQLPLPLETRSKVGTPHSGCLLLFNGPPQEDINCSFISLTILTREQMHG